MIPYLTIYFINPLFIRLKTISSKLPFYTLILITLLAGLRNYSIGWDTEGYLVTHNFYNSLSLYEILTINESLFSPIEMGYPLLVKLIYSIFNHHSFFLLFISFIYYYSYYKFAKFYKLDFNFFLLLIMGLGMFTFVYTALRQSIAISFVTLSFIYIHKRDFPMFLLLVLLAFNFHKTSIIVIPFYFVALFRFKKHSFLLYVFLFCLIYYYRITLFDLLRTNFGFENYDVYNSSGPVTFTILLLLINFIGYYYLDLFKNNRIFYISFQGSLFSLLFVPLAFVHPALLRLSMFFWPYLFSLMIILLNAITKIGFKYLIYSTSFTVFTFLYYHSLQGSVFVPYLFFWN